MYPNRMVLEHLNNTAQTPISDEDLVKRLMATRDAKRKLEEENNLLTQNLSKYKLMCERIVRKRKILKEKNSIAENSNSTSTKVEKKTMKDDDGDNKNKVSVSIDSDSTSTKVATNVEKKIVKDIDQDNENKIPIGPHAKVHSKVLKNIKWHSYTDATRKILVDVFTRRVLATHSLTGKPSPAFPNKAPKKKLNPLLIEDIVTYISDRCHAPATAIRTSITTKCADEAKMLRIRKNNLK